MLCNLMGCLMGCFLPLGLSCGLFPTWHNQGRGSSISSTGKTQKGNVYPQKRKVRSVLRPSGPPSRSLPGYPGMTRSITTPPPILPQEFHQSSLTVRWYQFLLRCGERNCERSLFCPRTHHTDQARSRT